MAVPKLAAAFMFSIQQSRARCRDSGTGIPARRGKKTVVRTPLRPRRHRYLNMGIENPHDKTCKNVSLQRSSSKRAMAEHLDTALNHAPATTRMHYWYHFAVFHHTEIWQEIQPIFTGQVLLPGLPCPTRGP